MKFVNAFRKVFTNETDKKAEAILNDITHELEETSEVARRHAELLKKDGVTLKIFIATGGSDRVS